MTDKRKRNRAQHHHLPLFRLAGMKERRLSFSELYLNSRHGIGPYHAKLIAEKQGYAIGGDDSKT